jgi:Calcineurin-like phosphoesterase
VRRDGLGAGWWLVALAALGCNQDAHPRIVPRRDGAGGPDAQVPPALVSDDDAALGPVDDANTAPEADAAVGMRDAGVGPPVAFDPRPPPDPPPADSPQPPVRAELVLPPNVAALAPTDQDLKVAFIGDQGLTPASRAVLALIKEEGAQAVVHNGDFDYLSDPAAWDALVNEVLGDDYPYFSTIGNHDAPAFYGKPLPDGSMAPGYGAYISQRYAKLMANDPAVVCTGVDGFEGTCVFHGLTLVQSCVGVGQDAFGNPEFPASDAVSPARCAADGPQLAYLATQLAQRTTLWSVCSWHKNQHDMQAGAKRDEVGWGAYRTCMNAGALIINGHEHSYARTRALTDFGHPETDYGVTGPMDSLQIGFGRTFGAVTGLGGVGVRPYDRSHFGQTWLASVYTSDAWKKTGRWQTPPGPGSYGALFIRFNPGGQALRAEAYFKDLNGVLIDEFTIELDPSVPP